MSIKHKPHIVYIIVHDLGRYLGCHGRSPLPTPHLDALAAEGMLFTNHFCVAPSCSPSRGTITTGKYPHSNGLMGLSNPNHGWTLPASETTMPERLKNIGYETYLFGLQHERAIDKVRDRYTLGYDHVTDAETVGIHCGPVAEEVVGFLDNRSTPETKRESSDSPFFASVGFFEPHRPFHTDRTAGREDPDNVYLPPFLPDNRIVREEMAGFTCLLELVDNAVGEIVSALERNGLADDTLLIFTTDHGIDMPRAKGTLYDPGIETTFIARWPGKIPGGTRCNDLVSNVDHLPTILRIADGRIPDTLEGYSFAGVLNHDFGDYTPRKEIFAEKTHHAAYDPMRCIRTERHKFIYNFGANRPIEVLGRGQMDTTTAVPWLHKTNRPLAELYDLALDPLEQNNVSGSTEYEEIETELRERLESFLIETDDPLMRGCLPIPELLIKRITEQR